MKAIKLIMIVALVAFTSCKKMTFDEWYSCDEAYTKNVEWATEQYKDKNITASRYAEYLQQYKKQYDACIEEAKSNK